jgi:hypothetical protein
MSSGKATAGSVLWLMLVGMTGGRPIHGLCTTGGHIAMVIFLGGDC